MNHNTSVMAVGVAVGMVLAMVGMVAYYLLPLTL